MLYKKSVLAAFLLTWPLSALAQTTLIVPQLDEARTLSPDPAADTGGYAPTSNIYSHLVVMDWGVVAGTPAYGDLAKTWDISPDGKVYTFHLRPNVKWHDGKPLTSADVKFTYDRMIEKKYPYAAFLRNVATIETPDDQTVVITLKSVDMSFVPMMAQAAGWTGKIYPQHLWKDQPGFDTGPYVNAPVGSGPFKFVRWDRGSSIELAANPDYFLGKPSIDRLIFRPIPDTNVARAEFDAEQYPHLPYDYAPPLAEVAALQADPSIQVTFTPSHYSRDIQLNTQREPFSNLKVREAIAAAIDRDAMSRLGFAGLWKPAIHANVDTQKQWINTDVRFPAFDKKRAEALLDEAGYPRGANGMRFAAKVTGPSYSDCKAINEVLVQQLRDVGIDAKLEQFDQSTWFRRMQEKNFDISCYFTRYGPDPDAYREHFGTGGQRNFMGYSNPQFDELGARAVTLTNEADRAKLYKEMQVMLIRDLPYINLFNEQKTSLARAKWTGFPLQESGYDKSVTWFGYFAVKPPGK
ncbi:ABC transporter substrate-binding protein [Microvirga antarctica]|uniref:ABC transporter substrate-binding protein n=1 Tax=Microvirga antarctica TaxID=2819233 RepID=UPI001B308A36|nr:ABC transporter substrate-binding protein [Microvirga antarctica]